MKEFREFFFGVDEGQKEEPNTAPHEVVDTEDIFIHDEYCWVHTPGGWTCAECRTALAKEDREKVAQYERPWGGPGDEFL